MPKSGLDSNEEVSHLLHLFDGSVGDCIRFLHGQFQVIQNRSQALLTLGALTLTITGFSGPKIADTNVFARYSIAIGIFLVLCSLVILLLGTHRINWVTQAKRETDQATLRAIIDYRNEKTRFYRIELLLLVLGLTFYVLSVITYLVLGQF